MTLNFLFKPLGITELLTTDTRKAKRAGWEGEGVQIMGGHIKEEKLTKHAREMSDRQLDIQVWNSKENVFVH